jgi:hypothetical protein
MQAATAALNAYRDAVELRARFEAAHAGERPPAIKLAAMRADELHARRDLESAFRLAFAPVVPCRPLVWSGERCACGAPPRADMTMCDACLAVTVPG